jgi:hypothetical protein
MFSLELEADESHELVAEQETKDLKFKYDSQIKLTFQHEKEQLIGSCVYSCQIPQPHSQRDHLSVYVA